MPKNGSMEETWLSYDQKFLCSEGTEQNWTGLENLFLSTFSLFFPKPNFWREDVFLHLNLTFF